MRIFPRLTTGIRIDRAAKKRGGRELLRQLFRWCQPDSLSLSVAFVQNEAMTSARFDPHCCANPLSRGAGACAAYVESDLSPSKASGFPGRFHESGHRGTLRE